MRRFQSAIVGAASLLATACNDSEGVVLRLRPVNVAPADAASTQATTNPTVDTPPATGGAPADASVPIAPSMDAATKLLDDAGADDASTAVVDASATIPGNPVVVWHFDENGGESSSSAQGIMLNLVSGVQWVDGVQGSALRFGASSEANAWSAPNSALAFRGSMSIALWYRLTREHLSGCWAFVNLAGDKADGMATNDLYGFGFDNQRLYWYHESGNQIAQHLFSPTLSPQALSVGTWHHAVGVRDSENKHIDFYLDGQALASVDYTIDAEGGELSQLHFGIDAEHDTDPAAGCPISSATDLDEVLFYDRALSPTEVSELFEHY